MSPSCLIKHICIVPLCLFICPHHVFFSLQVYLLDISQISVSTSSLSHQYLYFISSVSLLPLSFSSCYLCVSNTSLSGLRCERRGSEHGGRGASQCVGRGLGRRMGACKEDERKYRIRPCVLHPAQLITLQRFCSTFSHPAHVHV